MSLKNIYQSALIAFFKIIFDVKPKKIKKFDELKNILIVRQHNQFGDMLAMTPLLRAVKEKFPKCELTLIASPVNYIGIEGNKRVDRLFIFDKKKILNYKYIKGLFSLLRKKYDAVVVPSTVSISFTSGLISRLAKTKIRIGPATLNGLKNPSDFFFNQRVELNWTEHPDRHVADFALDILRPFGINSDNFSLEIYFNSDDIKKALEFIESLTSDKEELIIGLHVGAGKPANRWSLNKFIRLIETLNRYYKAKFYLTGSRADLELIDYMVDNSEIELNLAIDKKISTLAAIISRSHLFISNDTGVMHVAGATSVLQVSIFGPTNPFQWAPPGKNKLFIRNSDLIDEISVDEVFDLCDKLILEKIKSFKG